MDKKLIEKALLIISEQKHFVGRKINIPQKPALTDAEIDHWKTKLVILQRLDGKLKKYLQTGERPKFDFSKFEFNIIFNEKWESMDGELLKVVLEKLKHISMVY